jgi:hypothetical protein
LLCHADDRSLGCFLYRFRKRSACPSHHFASDLFVAVFLVCGRIVFVDLFHRVIFVLAIVRRALSRRLTAGVSEFIDVAASTACEQRHVLRAF